MKLILTMFSTLILSFSLSVSARELTDLSLDIVTPKKGAEAKQEAFDKATDEATRRLTEELLGPEKTSQNWEKIRPRLLKNSTRFVLFIKGVPSGETADSTKITRV